jgi:organic hydroperoxide reductase OsmC/OhrA
MAHDVVVRWTAQGDFLKGAYSRGHEWQFDGGITVPASSSPAVVPPPRSVVAAVDPEEALVASVSSCHMLWFLDHARRAGMVVAVYEDRAEGHMARRPDGTVWVDRITLNVRVSWDGRGPDAAALATLHDKAHHDCFIANSLRSEVVVNAVAEDAA